MTHQIANVLTGSDNGVSNGNQQIAFQALGKKPGRTNFVSNIFARDRSAYGMTGRDATNVVEFRVPLSALNVTAEDSSAIRLAAMRDWLSDNPTQLLYELAESFEVTVTPEEIKAIKGENNVWADTGPINELKYWKH